ncbi:MAG TPA: prenyltransferase/squalene oxidase repeat-containing protein [Solirubrobacteraceae bacterium]|nr:prenyltransferase/squalene oxidase repeat-containing protein [Solirubrobacteraceae bacterium]
MTWQIGAFTILFVALAAGFAWYERRRPDARVVALVATLAALAAVGRIAFAALPNVKPTTDIVLIAGYALGPGPGFAVGAIAGLTSNFFFGQGPWTPWQMAAWGMTGLIGAGLAGLTGRRIGRWTLAAVCGIVGFAFTVVQDVGDWVTYSDHGLAQLGLYVGKGLGFDAVHAAGCVAFALTFGPALARSVGRFARRLDVTWSPPGSAVLPALLVAAVTAGWVGVAGAGRAAAASSPTGYLLAAQNQDGGFGSAPGQPSSALYSGWAALGLAAQGIDPARVSHGGATLMAYLASGARGLSDPGSLERTILAVRAAGLDPTAFGGRNLVSALQGDIRADGSVSGQTNLTAFAILAMRAAGLSPPGPTVGWLLGQSDRDGGFNFASAGGLSDVDDTGAVLEALAGVPGSRAADVRARAVSYIEAQQDRDGGFPATPGAGSNAQSTAWAIQGLIAVGVNPSGVHRGGSGSPDQYLDSLIAPDGHVRYSRTSDQTPVWVTGEALMALAGRALPFPPLGGGGQSGPPGLQRGTGGRARSSHSAASSSPTHRTRHRGSAAPGHAARQLSDSSGLLGYLSLADAVALAPVGLG